MAQNPPQAESPAAPPAAAPPAPETAPRPSRFKTFSSLQYNRNYRFLWSGNLFANCAQWLQVLTVGWLALELSGGSALQSGTAVGIRTIPTLVLGPWAGVLADRFDRRKIAIISQVWLTVAAIVFAVLVATDRAAMWQVYLYMIANGVGFTIMQPVRQALVANTVRRSDLPNALALNAMAVTSMRLVGPLIGGILIETVGFKWNFFAQAGMYVCMMLLLLPLRTPYRDASQRRRASPWANLLDGIRYIRDNRVMFRLNIMNFVRSAVFQPLALMLPVYTHAVLNSGAGVGTLLLTSMGVGGLSATALISSWRFFTNKGMVSLLMLASGSSAILLLGVSHWIWVSAALLALLGFAQTHFIVSNQTSIQTVVPDNFRGRISSVWQYQDGLTTLWVFLITVVADVTTVSAALIITGGVALAFSLLFLFRFKDVRELP